MLQFFECLPKIFNYIINMFEAHRHHQAVWLDPGSQLFLLSQLLVGCCSRLNDKSFYFAHIGQVAYQFGFRFITRKGTR